MLSSNANTIKKLTDTIVVLVLIVISLSLLLVYTMTYAKPEKEPVGVCGVIYNPDENPAPPVFKMQCASCHGLNKRLVGPALHGVLKRVPSEEWFNTYITNEEAIRQANGDYIIQLRQDSVMSSKWSHRFNYLTQEHLDELKAYFK